MKTTGSDPESAEGAASDAAAALAAMDALVDEASMQSFPASDPPSFWARSSETR